jgi:carbon storage regulator
MLVLTRKQGERICIGDGITIIVKRIARNRVVIGIEAARPISISRSELERRHRPPRSWASLSEGDAADT